MDQPASTHAPPPAGYTGPYRAWGPPKDQPITSGPGRHNWVPETVQAIDGPFTLIRPHALEWWNGETWIGTD